MDNYSMLLPIVGMIAIFYFLMIRPQNQQRKKHEEMVARIKRGDRVILQGGIYGRVKHVGEAVFNVEIAPDVVVEQVKSMVLSVEAKPEPQAKKDAPKKTPAQQNTAKQDTPKQDEADAGD